MTNVGKTVASIDTSIRRDAVWLGVIPLVAALCPFLMSSTFWTFHDEWKTISIITWEVLAVSQLVVIILFAMWQPRVRSLPLRCLDVAALLVLVVIIPLVIQTLVRFWLIRPDSWDLLIWRLEDDWSRGLFLNRLRQSVCLLMVALLLWAWALVSKQRLTLVGQVPLARSKKMSIQSLMMTTTLVAGLASALLKVEWTPSVQDLRELLKAIPISLTVAAVGACVFRRNWSSKFLAIGLVSIAWVVMAIGNVILLTSFHNLPISSRMLVGAIPISAASWIFVALISWLILRWRGLQLVQLADETPQAPTADCD